METLFTTFNKLSSDILLYCIIPYLNDEGLRNLYSLCKKTKMIVDKYCSKDETSMEDLCQKGNLLIIYKRKLIVNNPYTFRLVCERGYIGLVRKTLLSNRCKFLYACGLEGACRRNRCKIINLLIEKGANDWDRGLYGACYGGHEEIADLMLKKGAVQWSVGMKEACKGGHRKTINLMISLLGGNVDVSYWNWGLGGACEGGHKDIINEMIEKGANNWNLGLEGACRGGRKDIINLMIEKGANKWNWGLHGACEGGHRDIVDLMIEKGANDWNHGLYSACIKNHKEIVKLMITLADNNIDVYNWEKISFIACLGKHHDIIKLAFEGGMRRCGCCHKTFEEHL